MAILTDQLVTRATILVSIRAAENPPTKSMSENVTSETISKSHVEAAITSVMGKGWDLNPYTVAEEAKVSPADISRNREFMQMIVDARGGDVSFKTTDPGSQSRVAELEAEVKSLRSKLETSTGAADIPGLPDDDILNEQVKALLSSESDEQVKHLERELEQALAQVVTLEEDKVDLARSVSGLERVNEAINARLRELESESAILRNSLKEQAGTASSKGEMENINREMALRMEELVSSNRSNNEHIALLEMTNQQHESLILELEAKLAELQQEADMLALQLQNAFNIGYQKGLSERTPENPDQISAQDVSNAAAQAEFAPTHEQAPATEQVATGDQVVYTPGQYYEMHQEMPNVEMRQSEPAPAPLQDQQGAWEPDRVMNFAKTGPYVASTFNPLESLSWRDLETVYSMGVLSIRDFSKNLTDYAQGGMAEEVAPEAPQPAASAEDGNTDEQAPKKRKGPDIDYSIHAQDSYEQPETQVFQAQEPVVEQSEPEAPKGENALDFIDELIDIDKLDIFESLEELEELGTIDVLNEPINIDFDQPGESTTEDVAVEAAQVSDEQLRELIKNRAAAAKEMGSDMEVRTPPAPDGSKAGLSGLKKFVGGKAAPNPGVGGLGGGLGGGQAAEPAASAAGAGSSNPANSVLSKHIPQEIRKNCMLLGLRPEELTKETVLKEWKKQITAVHPDLGGDTESSIVLNTAKDSLLRWLEQNTPKLGGKFGSKAGGSSSPFTGKTKPDDKS